MMGLELTLRNERKKCSFVCSGTESHPPQARRKVSGDCIQEQLDVNEPAAHGHTLQRRPEAVL